MKQYNWRYLVGDKMTDEDYQRLCKEEGIIIPDEYLHTPRINEYFISIDPENNAPFIDRKLAEHGLLMEEGNG